MIPQIDPLLKVAIANALDVCFQHTVAASDITLASTRKDFEGHRTLVTFAYTKALGKGPEQIGQALGAYLLANEPLVSGFNVVKGFLNLVVSDTFWATAFEAEVSTPTLSQLDPKTDKVMVEYSSPNTNKPMHLGHLRTNFLGYAVSNILKAAGHEVVMANLVNDRGIHICKSMIAYQMLANGATPESSGIKGDHLVGDYYVAFNDLLKAELKALEDQGMTEDEAKKQAPIQLKAQEMLQAWEAGDPEVIELWTRMNGWVYAGFESTYKSIGVSFDKYYYESQTYLLGKDIVEEGLANGVFYAKEDGSVWIDLSAEGLDHKLVRRKDGTSVYITQDMGTSDLKYADFGATKSIYVVGNEQDYHFAVLFQIMKKLGRPYAKGLYHLSYGMVELPAGKMKSREGTVVDADDLVALMIETARERTMELGKVLDFDTEEANALFEMLGVGAIKYYLLKVEPQKTMIFNPAESIDMQGNTATFIQYTHARIRSIVRKGTEMGLQLGIEANVPVPADLNKTERELIILLSELPIKVQEAADNYSPAVIANYTYELARAYNQFFAECPVFKAETPELIQFRVALSEVTGRAIKEAFGLLGIQVPERM